MSFTGDGELVSDGIGRIVLCILHMEERRTCGCDGYGGKVNHRGSSMLADGSGSVSDCRCVLEFGG